MVEKPAFFQDAQVETAFDQEVCTILYRFQDILFHFSASVNDQARINCVISRIKEICRLKIDNIWLNAILV